MKLRRNFERLCYRNRDKGIPNLMLWIALGNVLVYLFAVADPSGQLISLLTFDRTSILHGQIWRLLTYVFIPSVSNDPMGLFFMAIMLFFYYQIGRMLENSWGVFRFNMYYLCGVLIMDIAAIALSANASIGYLNLSLLLAFATLMPENQILLLLVIPLKMKYLAWFYFAMTFFRLISTPFPYNLFPVFALLNYLLFFGNDIKNVLPDSLKHANFKKPSFGQKGNKSTPNAKWASGYKNAAGDSPYHHKCTVCGKTDTQSPNLEFRYCSRCKGYHCYCIDHINNHEHIQE